MCMAAARWFPRSIKDRSASSLHSTTSWLQDLEPRHILHHESVVSPGLAILVRNKAGAAPLKFMQTRTILRSVRSGDTASARQRAVSK
jgi:hypothetical protein